MRMERLGATGIDGRVHPLVDMHEVTWVEDQIEEGRIEPCTHHGVDFAAGDPKADRFVPLADCLVIGRDQSFRIVRDPVG